MNRNKILQDVYQYAEEELGRAKFIPGKSPVPVSGPKFYPEDIQVLVDAVLDMWYTDWKHCKEFREVLCDYTGKKYCVLTNSGSSASLIAMSALLKTRSKKLVITTAVGFPTTVYPIYQNGKVPYFVDIDPKTLQPDWEQVKSVYKKYSYDVAGFVFAHTLGFPFDEIRVSGWHDTFLLSDCCDALGSFYHADDEWLHVGKYADAMTLSFFPAHHICTGEGGAILTDDAKLADMMNKLTNWGRDCYCLPGQSNTCGHRFTPEYFEFSHLPEGWDHKYTFTELGYNLKMTELQAALGVAQMQHIDDFGFDRRDNYDLLYNGLEYTKEHLDLIELGWASPFGFPIQVKPKAKFTAQELIEYLERHKISTRRIFGGNLTRQPVFEHLPYVKTQLPNSDYLMENAFWIGIHPSLTEVHLDYVLDIFSDFFDERGL